MLKRLRALIILAGFCAACGGTPADTEAPTKAALTGAQVFQSSSRGNPGTFANAGYWCGGGYWFFQQPIYQHWVGSNYYTQFTSAPGGVNVFRNEIQIRCDSELKMTDYGGYLQANGTTPCTVYAHPAGQTSWVMSVTGMKIPAGGDLQYFPIQSGYPSGNWWIALQMPGSLSQIGTGYGITACISGGDVNGLGGYWSAFAY